MRAPRPQERLGAGDAAGLSVADPGSTLSDEVGGRTDLNCSSGNKAKGAGAEGGVQRSCMPRTGGSGHDARDSGRACTTGRAPRSRTYLCRRIRRDCWISDRRVVGRRAVSGMGAQLDAAGGRQETVKLGAASDQPVLLARTCGGRPARLR